MIKLSYRPEIDGLRAISVIAVVFYHVEIFFNDTKLLSGGFIGVDIFFVISGYLITSIIIKEIYSTNGFSLLNFYKRRARRILPALFGMIAISIIFAWTYLTPTSFMQYSKSILSSIFFFSNYFFYFEGLVYNAENSLLKPLLHTWSLSVEEQFYIIFPLLLIFISRFFNKNFFLFFLILFFLSFISSIYTTKINSMLSFFSTFSRAWEFIAGSFLAYIEIKQKKFKYKDSNFLSILGLILIVCSIFFFNNNTFHPSYITIMPILGAVLIILSPNPKTLVNKILSSFIFVKIGLISYSFYLWHFPVFAFARNRGKELSDFDKIELLAVTIVLSILSYLFIEKPFRNKNLISFKYIMVIIFIFSSSFVYLNHYSNKTNGFDNRLHVFLKNTQRVLLEHSVKDKDGNCFERIDNFCSFNKFSKDAVFLIGDSHLEVLSEDLLNRIKQKKMNYISMNRGSCIYLPNFKKVYKKNNEEVHNCTLESKKIIDLEIEKNPNSIIILGGNFKEHFNKVQEWEYQSELNLKPLEHFTNSIVELLKNDYKVVLIYPIPTPEFHVIKRLMQDIPKSTFNASKYLTENKLTFDLDKHYSDNINIINSFNNLKHKNLIKVYPEDLFCDKIHKLCFTHSDKEIFYSDERHLAREGVKMLNNEIEKSIDKLIKN